MGKNTITIISENYENESTHEAIEGLTIMLDGVLKEVFDKLKLDLSKNEMSNSDFMGEVIMHGVNAMIEMAKQEKPEVK